MGTIKVDELTGITGDGGINSPITLSGDTATITAGGTFTGTLGSSVKWPASYVRLGGLQNAMTTRSGVLKWPNSQIPSVTGSAFTIDNTGSFTKIQMEANSIIWITWAGVVNNTSYYRINKNNATSVGTTAPTQMAYSYGTHQQVHWHGYGAKDDYFVCDVSGTLQSSTDYCWCSVIALMVE
jgi:hypothetical protein